MIKLIKRTVALFSLTLLMIIVGCNKEEEGYMATEVRITGYNNIGEALEIQIDTILYKNPRIHHDPLGNKYFPENNIFTFSYAYLYFSAENPILKIKGKSSGKVYMEKNIEKGVLRQRYAFTLVNGKDVYEPPASDPATNKIGFFLADPFIKEPIDILMSGKQLYNNKDKPSYIEEKKYLIQGLPPNKWVYIDYIPFGIFAEKKIYKMKLTYFKAGTQEYAFGNGYFSETEIDLTKKEKSTFPVLEQRGRVISYLIAIERNDQGEYMKQFSVVDW